MVWFFEAFVSKPEDRAAGMNTLKIRISPNLSQTKREDDRE
jgi:hypothetical protein